MKIAIIGAGFVGLTAGLRLSQKGHEVVIFEKENFLGGLSAGFRQKDWQWSLENFFHHLFTSDKETQKLIKELCLSSKLFYRKPKASIFKNNKISQFDSLSTVLTFPHLPFLDKVRTGLIIFYLKITPFQTSFEKVTASQWLKKAYGEKAYRTIWEPLLESKFGKYKERITMSWFWTRIKKRSLRLGYLEGGFQVLLEKLSQEIKKKKGKIYLGREITSLSFLKSDFDKIIVTTPTSIFLKIAPSLPKSYRKDLTQLKMIGSLNLVLILKRKFLEDGTYWLNINEKGFPFVAVVEHTNFVSSKHYNNCHLLYLGGYYPQNHRFLKMKKEQILQEFLPYLKKVNPNFEKSSIINSYLSTNFFAQPIVTFGYRELIPDYKTPIPNIFLVNMQQVYPWDRGINQAIIQGEKIAKEAVSS